MLRDLVRLRRAAGRVQDDLHRTSGRAWSCFVGDDYVLSVADGRRVEQVLLEAEIKDEDWFLPLGFEETQLDGLLDADADEVVGSETAQVLGVLGIRWPVCADHGGVLDPCSSWWLCDSAEPHDVAAVGFLDPQAARSEPAY